MTRLAVIANSKKLRGAQRKALKVALDEAGLGGARWIEIDKGSAATKAAEKALDHHADVVLACGGDGTVRAAAHALVGSDAALAVLPAGTANLFASAMAISDDPAEVLQLVCSGERRTIDTGRCNGMTFNVMAGSGFDAAMIDSADEHKERMGMVAYVRAGTREARRREAFRMSVDIDGEAVFEGPASCILVGNIGTLKGGVEAFPAASPTDGKLDIAVLTATGLKAWAGVMVSAVRKRQQLSGHTHMWTGSTVSVRTDQKHRFELDGGVKGTSKKLAFEIVPKSLTVCAPPA